MPGWSYRHEIWAGYVVYAFILNLGFFLPSVGIAGIK